MENKIRAHDGIAGAVYMLSVILGAAVSTQWLWIAGIVAGLQIISPVTQFCPVYFGLNKMMPDTEPVQSGRRKQHSMVGRHRSPTCKSVQAAYPVPQHMVT